MMCTGTVLVLECVLLIVCFWKNTACHRRLVTWNVYNLRECTFIWLIIISTLFSTNKSHYSLKVWNNLLSLACSSTSRWSAIHFRLFSTQFALASYLDYFQMSLSECSQTLTNLVISPQSHWNWWTCSYLILLYGQLDDRNGLSSVNLLIVVGNIRRTHDSNRLSSANLLEEVGCLRWFLTNLIWSGTSIVPRSSG